MKLNFEKINKSMFQQINIRWCLIVKIFYGKIFTFLSLRNFKFACTTSISKPKEMSGKIILDSDMPTTHQKERQGTCRPIQLNRKKTWHAELIYELPHSYLDEQLRNKPSPGNCLVSRQF